MSDLDIDGLDIDASARRRSCCTVDEAAVRAELPQVREHLEKFGADLSGHAARRAREARVAAGLTRALRRQPCGLTPKYFALKVVTSHPNLAGKVAVPLYLPPLYLALTVTLATSGLELPVEILALPV